MRYILHYTRPGDIVFDGFCGTGMTGVAAQMCGNPDAAFKYQLEREMRDDKIEWGARRAILNDLSPAASFIAYNYNTPVDVAEFEREARRILTECEAEYGWMYETLQVDAAGVPLTDATGQPVVGRIHYTVWADVLVCPSCSKEIDFYDAAFHEDTGRVDEEFTCPHCASRLRKRDCPKSMITRFDPIIGQAVTQVHQRPKLISYSVGRKRYAKRFSDADAQVQARIDATAVNGFVPTDRWIEGEKPKEPIRLGLERIHQSLRTCASSTKSRAVLIR